jgi:hypothetical protein
VTTGIMPGDEQRVEGGAQRGKGRPFPSFA